MQNRSQVNVQKWDQNKNSNRNKIGFQMWTSIALVLDAADADFNVVDSVTRIGNRSTFVVVNPIAISRNENWLLLVILIVDDDVLDATLTLQHVAEPCPVGGWIGLDRAGEVGSEAGGASAVEWFDPVQVPGHLVAFYRVFVHFSDDNDSGRFALFWNV